MSYYRLGQCLIIITLKMYQLKIYITALIKLKFVFTSFKLDFNHPLLNLQLKKKSTIFLKWNCKINFKKASTKHEAVRRPQVNRRAATGAVIGQIPVNTSQLDWTRICFSGVDDLRGGVFMFSTQQRNISTSRRQRLTERRGAEEDVARRREKSMFKCCWKNENKMKRGETARLF